MNFRVVWRHRLLDRLADYYVAALESGEAFTRAAARIDFVLRTNPHEAGESRGAFQRIYFAPPLIVDFEIYDEAEVVFVTALRYLGHPHSSP
ncbi:MAG TPA: hypothetical protein VE988_18070 [Gemmataceae bacterium]|nr:hypothetical protein [Gemmataceae bacterium]